MYRRWARPQKTLDLPSNDALDFTKMPQTAFPNSMPQVIVEASGPCLASKQLTLHGRNRLEHIFPHEKLHVATATTPVDDIQTVRPLESDTGRKYRSFLTS